MHGLQTKKNAFIDYSADYASALLNVAIVCATVWLFTFTAMTLSSPILDSYGFRQTQTAINVYYMLHENAIIDYLTPILGAPWTLPFEAPVYQIFVAAFSKITHLNIDASGRVVSLAFFFLVLGSGYSVIKSLLPGDRYTARLFVFLALISPIYLFWARTFMIETCALGLCMAWLAIVIKSQADERLIWSILSVPLCTLAALAKVTTWPTFIVAGCFYIAVEVVRNRKIKFAPTLIVASGIVVALLATLFWNRHADQMKIGTTFGASLTSSALNSWNFGNWSQFFGKRFWFELLPNRMLPDAIGYCWPVLLILFRYARGNSRRTILGVISIALFFTSIAFFTNLHMVHEYYQSANAIFLVAAAAFLLSELVALDRRGLAMIVAAIISAGAMARFSTYQKPLALQDVVHNPFYVAAKLVKEQTKPGTTLIVFGADWSSEVHYYAERKGVAFPGWATPEQAAKVLGNADGMMGGAETASVVDCRPITVRYGPEIDSRWMSF